MASVSLPSADGAQNLEQIIDRMESFRKEVEFLFNHLNSDNITGIAAMSIDWKSAGDPPHFPVTSDDVYNKAFTTYIDNTHALTQNIYAATMFADVMKANNFLCADPTYPILFYAGDLNHLRMSVTETYFQLFDKNATRYFYADANGAILNNEDVATHPWVIQYVQDEFTKRGL